MKKITLFLAFFVFVGVNLLQAQQKVTGVITSSEDGSPIPGVNVVVKDQPTIGTATDIEGRYTLTVPSGSNVLLFTSIGMEDKEVEINGRSEINLTMEPAFLTVDEVVVTALGISREKKALGYSVQEVGGEEITQAQQSDALSALQGRVAGVQIRSSSNMGGSNKVTIRGATSITGDNQPLIVVDGVPLDNSNYNSTSTQSGGGGVDYGNMMNDVPPNEIASISVLKGAAAALYGSRAANGVILITTKSAKQGKESFSIDVSSSVDFEEKYLIPNLQRKYGGGAIIGGTPDGFEQVNINGTDYNIVQYQVDESWGPRYDENIQVLHWDAFSPESYPDQYLQTRPWVAPDNDVITFWDLGVIYKNNIGISKAGRNYGLRFSYGNQNGNGTMPGSEINKNSVKIAGNANLTEKFSISGAMNFVTQYMKGRPEVGYGDNSVGQKFFQWGQRQLDYDRLRDYKNDDGTQRTWNRQAWDNPAPKYADNPYWTAYENYPEDERDRFYGNFSASYQITDALSASGAVYGDTYTFYVRERSSIGSQATSFYSEMVRNRSEFNYEGRLTFDKEFGDIRISSVGGGNIRKVRYDSNYGVTSGGLAVPGIFSVLNSNGSPSINDYSEEKQVNSLFLQGALTYGGFLNLDASIRNDWSSTLPEDENSYFYYGVSGSFIFSELVDLAFMDLGKVRLGHTQVGNDTDPYRVKTTYSYNTDGTFGDAPRLFISNDLVNANLKPETTTTNEVGLDLIFFGNRLDLSATYFNKVTTDQILPLEVSKATGYQTKYINAGELSSKGFEVSLGAVPVRTQDFEWAVRFNLTKTKQLVEKLYESANVKVEAIDIVRAPFGGVFLRASEGDEYGQLWGHDYVYDDEGNKVVDGGLYASTPLKPLGSVFPDYNLGIRNSLSYKNFDFSALIDIQKGGVFYSLSHMWGMYSGMLEETAGVNDQGNEIRSPVSEGGGIKLDGVTGDITWNDDGSYTVTNTAENTDYISGSLYGAGVYHGYGTPSAQSVFDADYIKLREVTLGYTLPQELTGFIKKVRISVYGRNLLTWGLDQEGFDPEMTVTGSGNIQGIDGGLQPMSRTFGVNLKLQF